MSAVRLTLDATDRAAYVYTSRGSKLGHVLTLGPVTAEGVSLPRVRAEATARAARYLDALATDHAPIVVTFRGYTMVGWVEPGHSEEVQWSTRTIGPDAGGWCSRAYEGGRFDREARMRYDLAQRTTDQLDDVSVRGGWEFIPASASDSWGTSLRDEFLRMAGWQRAARAAMDAGREDWHEWASAHTAEFTPVIP